MAERPSERRVPELDGVRGLAILLVLCVHFGLTTHASGGLRLLLTLGWSGVDLFFVLSGFLITGILLDTRAAPHYFRAFYMRRVLRIFPLYYAFLAVFFFVVLPLASRAGTHVPPGPPQLWYWLYISNWKSALGPDYAFLSHLWSLSIEEQFYLVWPPLVLWLGLRRLPWLCLALVAGAFALRFAWRVNDYGGEFLYRLTPFRVDTLAMGALLAVGVRDERWLKRLARWYRPVWVVALSGLCAVVWMAGTSRNNHPLVATWGFSLLSLIYACTVFHAHNGSAVLRFPPLRTLGKYSYGVYMMHFPLVGYFFIWMAPVGTALGPSLGAVVALALGTCASLGLALISWHLVEKRFLTLKDRFKAFNAG